MSGVYLDPAQAGLRWLLDPESPRLRAIARDAIARAPDAPCDAAALAAESELLDQVVRERHFGVASGIVAAPDGVLDAWRARLGRRPATWREAVTDLQFDLRHALGDQHVRVWGAPRWRDGVERENDGPAVDEQVVDGVLVLSVRRLIGSAGDERLLAAWSRDADRHFEFDRIVVDFRGNPGGNDGHTYDWALRRLRPVAAHVRETVWTVRGTPAGNWNAAAWYAAHADAVPPHLLAGRHAPMPGDELVAVEQDWELPAGDTPWGGRMVVLVDRWSRSSAESSAWLLRDGLGARLAGEPTAGMIEYGNVVPYVLPRSGLVINLPTKHNDYGFPVEHVGFPVDVPLEPGVPAADVARAFDTFV